MNDAVVTDPAQVERLALLAEECGEVVLAVGKYLRHGRDSRHPDGGPTNEQQLAKEVADVVLAVYLCLQEGDIQDEDITRPLGMNPEHHVNAKNKYLHHNVIKAEAIK